MFLKMPNGAQYAHTLKKNIGNIYQSCIKINKPGMLIFNQQMVG
jgi:hypothetical protein